ncbi:MAG: hypothetical protein HFG28_10325 [Eubacterium sp.]|nr:hypothetical protein [Eubacterium sp.]
MGKISKKHALRQYEIYYEHRLHMQEEPIIDELLQNAEDIKMERKQEGICLEVQF